MRIETLAGSVLTMDRAVANLRRFTGVTKNQTSAFAPGPDQASEKKLNSARHPIAAEGLLSTFSTHQPSKFHDGLSL